MAQTVTASTTPIQPITPPSLPTPLPLSPSGGAAITYAVWDGEEVPDTLMDACAALFSNNYGIWGSNVPKRQGKPVKLNGARLRAQCLSNPAQTVLVTCFKQNQLIGHVFATVWDVTEVGSVGWITQLVVRKEDRKHWVATHLLQTLKSNHRFSEIAALGLVSSHPAACTALAKCANAMIESIDLTFCRDNAQRIIEVSNVDYVQRMQLRGSLFEENCTSGAISTVYTEFFVDHEEPLAALQVFKQRGNWVLGELLDGHEFLIILPITG